MAQSVSLQPVSNREDWDDTFSLFDPETDDALDLTAVTAIELIVWDPETRRTLLTASIGDGITITDITGGVIAIHFDRDDIEDLCAKSYAFRVGMTNGGAIKDLMIGTLPIIDGGPN